MKGERRHELQRNELADWLGKVLGTIKPYQNAILALVLLMLVATVAYSWWVRQSSGKQVQGWDAFQAALWRLSQGDASPTDFEDIASQHADTDVGRWARVMAADLHLAFGCDMLFVNKGKANQELRQAEDDYLKILAAQGSSSELRERATFGLARARESQGNLQKATELYQEVDRNWPGGAYATAAASRLEDLKRADTKQLYDQFAKFDPQPVSSSEPGAAGQRPAFDLNSLPEGGPVVKPELPKLEEKGAKGGQPPESPKTPAKPADTQPNRAGTPEAAAKATEEKPGEAKSPGTGATDRAAANTETSPTEKAGKNPADSSEAGHDKVASPGIDKGEAKPADSVGSPPTKSP
jgi:tetratricopeptide (TPR) repeat protein